jgi:hypothetical protein
MVQEQERLTQIVPNDPRMQDPMQQKLVQRLKENKLQKI